MMVEWARSWAASTAHMRKRSDVHSGFIHRRVRGERPMHDSFIGFLEKWVRSFAYERLRNDELVYMQVSAISVLMSVTHFPFPLHL